jgi:hypothetical protein
MPQTLDYIKILPSIPAGAESALIRPHNNRSNNIQLLKGIVAIAHFLKAFPATLSVTHGLGKPKMNRRRFKAKVWHRVSLHQPNQPRVDQEPTHYTPVETHNSPITD